jgi:hypothetical protein
VEVTVATDQPVPAPAGHQTYTFLHEGKKYTYDVPNEVNSTRVVSSGGITRHFTYEYRCKAKPTGPATFKVDDKGRVTADPHLDGKCQVASFGSGGASGAAFSNYPDLIRDCGNEIRSCGHEAEAVAALRGQQLDTGRTVFAVVAEAANSFDVESSEDIERRARAIVSFGDGVYGAAGTYQESANEFAASIRSVRTG